VLRRSKVPGIGTTFEGEGEEERNGEGEGVRERDGAISRESAEVVGNVPNGDDEYGVVTFGLNEKYRVWKLGGALA
jgi:hypothetical protein